jgi:hypothetical protein
MTTKTLTSEQIRLTRKIKTWIIFFMVFLALSGITAFPIESQLEVAMQHLEILPKTLQSWFTKVYTAVHYTNTHYPFLSYGTDWLAFAHLVIAVAFIGPLMDPVRNIWVIQFGMIACLMVVPLAMIAGAVREIPIYWRLIDCSFGLLGIIPLYFCYKDIKKLEKKFTL